MEFFVPRLHHLMPLVLLFVLAPFAVRAADGPAHMPAPIIAIIDVQRILEESLAAKSVQKQLEAQRAKFQSETENEENGLRKEEDELGKARDQASTPDAVPSEREQQLRQKMLMVERRVDTRRKLLEQAFDDSMKEVRKMLLGIVESIAKSHGANLVLVKQQALWVDAPLDITDEVLTQLNQKMPQLTVNIAPETKP
jgi:Skp family chaperone for outer membrane proteins